MIRKHPRYWIGALASLVYAATILANIYFLRPEALVRILPKIAWIPFSLATGCALGALSVYVLKDDRFFSSRQNKGFILAVSLLAAAGATLWPSPYHLQTAQTRFSTLEMTLQAMPAENDATVTINEIRLEQKVEITQQCTFDGQYRWEDGLLILETSEPAGSIACILPLSSTNQALKINLKKNPQGGDARIEIEGQVFEQNTNAPAVDNTVISLPVRAASEQAPLTGGLLISRPEISSILIRITEFLDCLILIFFSAILINLARHTKQIFVLKNKPASRRPNDSLWAGATVVLLLVAAGFNVQQYATSRLLRSLHALPDNRFSSLPERAINYTGLVGQVFPALHSSLPSQQVFPNIGRAERNLYFRYVMREDQEYNHLLSAAQNEALQQYPLRRVYFNVETRFVYYTLPMSSKETDLCLWQYQDSIYLIPPLADLNCMRP